MSDFQQELGPLGVDHFRDVEGRISSALGRVASDVTRFGTQHFYENSWYVVPHVLRGSARQLANGYRPPMPGDDGEIDMDPFAAALEMGVITGAMVARGSLGIARSTDIASTMALQLDHLRQHPDFYGGTDPEEYFQMIGGNEGRRLADSKFSPVVTLNAHPDEPVEERRCALYANTVGFMVVQARVHLLSDQLARQQETDVFAPAELRADADWLYGTWQEDARMGRSMDTVSDLTGLLPGLEKEL